MENDERSGSGGRNDWPVRLSGAAGGMVGGAIALFVIKPRVELPAGLGPFAFVGLAVVGIILGQFIGARVFRSSSDVPSDTPPAA